MEENKLSFDLDASFDGLKQYCEDEEFKGWDPYDGLNSWVIQKTFLGRSRFFRLAWIQGFKRSPINFRNLFGVKKGYNPKGLGLFLIGYCNLYKTTNDPQYISKIDHLVNKIVELKSKGYSGACWGYNFDWQARAFFQPKYTPTIVATSFIAEALLYAYEITKNEVCLKTAISTKRFVLEDLNKTYDDNNNYTLSYSPEDKTQVFNAGLLGAKLLTLIYKHTNDESLLVEAKKIVEYVCSKQQENGAWAYGTLPYHQWVDNFHTGFNLECIYAYQKWSGDNAYEEHINKGLKYYLETFFTEDGISKYYNNKTYPVDIHAPAQLIITLYKLERFHENEEIAEKVMDWTIKNMQSNKGYFYFQKRKYITYKMPYIRWSQSWMFYALSYYKLHLYQKQNI